MDSRVQELTALLREISKGGVAVAFSGGVDSALLLSVLAALRKKEPFPLLAVTVSSDLQQPAEKLEAESLCKKWDVPFRALDVRLLHDDRIRHNPVNRCYLCKKELFLKIQDEARLGKCATVIDGTHADDFKVYRPGLRAIRELGIRSPLAELGFGKKDVRDAAASLGLECARKPSLPCLATRFEYGVELNAERLREAGEAENFIQSLFAVPQDVRVRVHGALARIEVPPREFPVIDAHRAEIIGRFRALHFNYVTLDLEGFRSGSMDASVRDK